MHCGKKERNAKLDSQCEGSIYYLVKMYKKRDLQDFESLVMGRMQIWLTPLV